VGPLSPYERRVWELDQRINQRGLRIDLPYVHACLDVVAKASQPLAAEFAELTGGLKMTQVQKLTAWCGVNGFPIDSLSKENLKALGIDEDDDEEAGELEMVPSALDQQTVPPRVRRALEIRAVLGSASIKKLHRMLACVNADGRVRYTLQYHGAGPGRWTGRLFQPQNFPRGKIEGGHDPDALVSAIFGGNLDYINMVFGDPIAAVASGLRHAIIAADEHEFNTGDFAGIEMRVVLALAGQHDKTALLASGKDVYLDMAEDIYQAPKGSFNKVQHAPQRQIGKNTVLGCGFQMGWQKFKDRYCPDMSDEFAQGVIRAYREVWAPEVPKLWWALENAALRAVQTQGRCEAYGITYQWYPHALACIIPDGQIMWYRDPCLTAKKMPWSTADKPDIRPCWCYQTMKQGQWRTVYAYGGLLCENVVQKIARGFLCEAMHRLEANGFPLVLTVHDECMSEISLARSDKKAYEQIMAEQTAYSRRIKVPIAVESWADARYRK
jgi:DNA polymerase